MEISVLSGGRPRPLLTVAEAAAYLGFHRNTVYKKIRQGQLPFIVTGQRSIRIRVSDLDLSLEESTFRPSVGLVPPPIVSVDGYDKLLLRKEIELANGGKRWHFGLGSITLRRTKQGEDRFYVDFQVGKKRVRRVVKCARTKADALRVLNAEIEEAYRATNNLRPQVRDISFEEMAELYLEKYSKQNKKSWRTSDLVYLRKLIPAFRGKKLSEIGAEGLEEYRALRLSTGLKKASVNREISCLRKMFNVAKAWRYAENNPVAGLKFYPENENLRERELSEDEEVRLLDSCSGHIRPLVITALNTGMRRGEILRLKWENVDLERREIRIVESKSGRMRIVPVNSSQAQILSSVRGHRVSETWVFLNSDTGKPFVDIKTAFRAACKRARIKNLRFHDLRHTFASRLVRRGADLKIVQELMGHASIITTQRYLHVLHKEKLAAVESLSQTPTASPAWQTSGKSDSQPKERQLVNDSERIN